MNKKKKIFIALGSVAGLLVLYFIVDYLLYTTTDNAQVEGHAVMLAAKVGGYVKDVKIVEGQKVNRGDTLVEIDHRDYENVLQEAKANLSSREARRRDAEKNFRRLQDLFSKGAVSQQQFDAASASYADEKAKYESLAAGVAQAELNLANTNIRAPSNGYIVKRSVEVGQLASPGVPLIGFVSSEERWVTANFKETDIEAVKVGAHVKVSVDAVSGRSFHGKVASISAATGATFTLLPPDNATGNFTKVVQRVPVRIEFTDLKPEDTDLLRAGLSAYVKISKH